MDACAVHSSLWEILEQITENLKSKRLADVFRFISFYPSETYGPHKHLRIEINYVKKGYCILHLDNESVTFKEGEIMVITSDVNHLFEAGSEGTTLMQLEFLPEIFSNFNLNSRVGKDASVPTSVFLFSEENRLIKIVNNVRIMRVVQRIVNELETKSVYYQYLVVMYYAELLVLIYRYMDEAYLPICTNDSLRKAIAYIRLNYHSDININKVAEISGISSYSRFIPKKFFQKNANNIGKSLLFKPGYDTIFGRMEVGFFFMPKIGQHRKLPRNTLTKIIKRGGSCAYKNHIRMYRMQAA